MLLEKNTVKKRQVNICSVFQEAKELGNFHYPQISKKQTEKNSFSNVPSNAVYSLRNHTKGAEERIFSIENKKIVWY